MLTRRLIEDVCWWNVLRLLGVFVVELVEASLLFYVIDDNGLTNFVLVQ